MKIFTPRNAFWPFLMALLTAISYLLVSTGVSLNQRIPFVWLALLLVALVWSVTLAIGKRSVLRFAALFGTVGVTALFSWWIFSYSEYGRQDLAVAEGDAVAGLAALALPDQTGLERPVLAEGGATLLVLYRGHW